MSKLGIMEGRLLPPEGSRLQCFPRERWPEEFSLAQQIQLSYIELIYDVYGADRNPLTNDPTRLTSLIESTGVSTRALCADYFMDRPFVRCSFTECDVRQRFLHNLLALAAKFGVKRLVLPFVDSSRIETSEDQATVVRVLAAAAPLAREVGVELHLETSLSPRDFAFLLDRLPDNVIKVNYDSGNSASLGFLPFEEFAAYGSRIGSVHIKDRILGGGSVPLGTGDADFPAIFRELEKIEYTGDLTMQAARDKPGQEALLARHNKAFIARFWPVN